MPVDPRPRARALTPLRRTTSAGSLLTLGLLAACSASSEDEVGTGGGGSTTPIPVASISGVVKTTQGLPLGGIDVKVADVMVTTDVNGLFIVGFPEDRSQHEHDRRGLPPRPIRLRRLRRR
ncbi:MAG: hypothetical protein ACYTFV_19040 [Planctomycetota bacterium]|jgi:hypothetical protein